MHQNKGLLIYISVFLFSINLLFAKQIPESIANQTAVNFIKANAAYFGITNTQNVQFKKVNTFSKNTKSVYYEFILGEKGFVIVAADDIVVPVLAYSNERISEDYKPIQFTEWSNNVAAQIEWCRNNQVSPTSSITQHWEQLLSGHGVSEKSKSTKNVSALVPCIWDQSYPFNYYCPLDAAGNGGHCYAGCTATAMAQIMYYFRYPLVGTGSHSYTHQNYGLLEAKYDTTYYQWNAMVDAGNVLNKAISLLQYHCGVAVEMDYGPDGSGAGIDWAGNGLKTYFGYSQNIEYASMHDYSTTDWATKIRNNIDNFMPIEYAGYDTAGGGGHAFVLDGYQGTDFYHFNWGWSGNYNGYYYLTALNPSAYDFINWQQAVFNIYPASNFPYSCSGITTLKESSGTFEDGSGPVNYQNNLDCKWLIAPTDSVTSITLSFKRFDTEASFDKVIVYKGSDTSGTVLGTFSGSNIPSAMTTQGNRMFVRFITNGTNTSAGWYASYTTSKPIFCSGVDTITAPSGTITDGSGMAVYNNMTNCKWYIAPQNASSIIVHFNSFNVDNGGDHVLIYNAAVDPPVALFNFSGNTIPSDFTCPSGKMLLSFFTNNVSVSDGWEATYTSVFAGIDENTPNMNYKVFPNPTSDYINIQTSFEQNSILDVKLFNINGERILNKIIPSNTNEVLNLTSFQKGVYILKITTSKESLTKKIILQ